MARTINDIQQSIITDLQTYFPKLLNYAATHDLILKGPVLELLWVDIHQSEDVQEHITELQIRIEKCAS